MQGRNFMKSEKLGILLDSKSFDAALSNSSQDAKRLISYHDTDFFEFLRTPFSTQFKELSDVTNFEEELDENCHLKGMNIVWSEKHSQSVYFGYLHGDVQALVEHVLKKQSLTNDELIDMRLVFIKEALSFNSVGLLVTENQDILNNRMWFEARFSNLNIATIQEAMEIMDIFAKMKGEHFIASHYTANKGLWYWYSFRSKVPHYHVSTPILDAFATRMTYLLKSVDEIATQYYWGVNNDTVDDMLYHFNYLIGLTTGIFDSLAIETRDRYKITFRGDHIPSRISLNNRSGEDFLKEVRNHNLSLRDHINHYVDYNNLIYQIREIVTHREGLKTLAYEMRDTNEKWKANFIVISKELAESIKKIGDTPHPNETISSSGVYKDVINSYYLEPFRFTKMVARNLVQFSDEYLKLLGFTNYVQGLNPQDEFFKALQIFQKNSLGF